MENKAERIAKFIARAGVCSRREAERMIEQGRVKLDGEVLKSPAVTVTDQNKIEVDGEFIGAREKTRLWLFHKPKGVITSHADKEGRKTVFEILPDDMPRVISIGRLDYNTEGLLLLTNDGDLSRKLELPSTAWIRRYRVRAYGHIDNNKIEILRSGVTIEGIKYAPAKIEVEKTQGGNSWLSISITEGKNREIRKMLEFADLEVNRLIRTSYGPFQLGNLKPYQVKEVVGKVIREQVG